MADVVNRDPSGVKLALLDQPAHQREAFLRRFGMRGYEPQTLQQIGDHLGVTRERARQFVYLAVRAVENHREMAGML
jgi:RNA polymerase nonessential primary-like sigma factor